jgi:hypothetical protein
MVAVSNFPDPSFVNSLPRKRRVNPEYRNHPPYPTAHAIYPTAEKYAGHLIKILLLPGHHVNIRAAFRPSFFIAKCKL